MWEWLKRWWYGPTLTEEVEVGKITVFVETVTAEVWQLTVLGTVINNLPSPWCPQDYQISTAKERYDSRCRSWGEEGWVRLTPEIQIPVSQVRQLREVPEEHKIQIQRTRGKWAPV